MDAASGELKVIKSILVERDLSREQVAALFVDAKGAALLTGMKVDTFG